MDDQPDTGQDTGPGDNAPLSAVEAAQRAGVHERTVRRAITSGKLKASKEHGAFRITPADLIAWQRTQDGQPPDPEPDQTDTTAADLSPVVDELRRILDLERTERQEAQREVSKLTGEMGYWRGQAEAFQHQLAALTAGGNDHHAEDDDAIPGDFTENAREASPEAPGHEEDSQGLSTPVGEESPRPALWRRLLGLS